MVISQEDKGKKKNLNNLFCELELNYTKDPSHVLCSCEIDSYEKYEIVVQKLSEMFAGSSLYYRGQPYFWYPMPGIGRKPFCMTSYRRYSSGLLDYEYQLLEKTRVLLGDYSDWKDLEIIEFLEKCQHYGMPTRLLDITTSADVALFFACHSNTPETGCVFVFVENDFVHSKVVEEFVGFMPVLMQKGRSIPLHVAVDQFNDKSENKITMDNIIEYYRSECPVCIRPKLDDSRIKNQEACFLLYGNRLYFDNTDVYDDVLLRKEIFDKKPLLVRNELQRISKSKLVRIKISPEVKSKMMDTLREKGIVHDRIYPSAENRIKDQVNNMMAIVREKRDAEKTC